MRRLHLHHQLSSTKSICRKSSQQLFAAATFCNSSSFVSTSSSLFTPTAPRLAIAGTFFRSQATKPETVAAAEKEQQQQKVSDEKAQNDAENSTTTSGKSKTIVSFQKMYEKTKVAFASAASTELVPSVAASEAYDLALASLRAATDDPDVVPNFCFTVISADHEGMIDAPQVVWKNFSSSSPESDFIHDHQNKNSKIVQQQQDETEKQFQNNNRVMIGSMVRNQRVGDGFIEVMLGVIPDLRYTSFTFDKVPKTVEEYQELLVEQQQHVGADKNKNKNKKNQNKPGIPSCLAGFVFSDWRIGGKHTVALGDRIAITNNLMKMLSKNEGKSTPPLVGAVLPPSESVFAQIKKQQIQQQQQQQELPSVEEMQAKEDEIAPSLFFVNDNVFRGSAGAVLLHSDLLDAHVSTLTPPVIIKDNVTIDEASIDEPTAVWTIKKLGGKPACEYIREIYETDPGLMKRKFSKLFLGVDHPKLKDQPFPLSFVGHPNEGGHISVTLPIFLGAAAMSAKTLTFLRDDEFFESQLIGQDLIQFEKSNLIVAAENEDEEKSKEEEETSTSFAMHDEKKSKSNFMFKTEKVRVHRERTASVVVANAAGLHFSHPELYTIFKRADGSDDGLLRFGGGNLEKHAPSVLRRVLGTKLPNTGMHASGIVVPFTSADDEVPPQVLPRASTHLMFTPKQDQ